MTIDNCNRNKYWTLSIWHVEFLNMLNRSPSKWTSTTSAEVKKINGAPDFPLWQPNKHCIMLNWQQKLFTIKMIHESIDEQDEYDLNLISARRIEWKGDWLTFSSAIVRDQFFSHSLFFSFLIQFLTTC